VDETGNVNEITVGKPEGRPLRRPGYRKKENVRKTDSIRIDVTMSRVRVTNVAAEKQLSITYSECVSVALLIHYAMCIICIVICGLFRSTTFFHIIS
jgi:hypothetical protein